MLKHIPSSLTPELVKLMMEMGHGEELLLADANFPALTNVKNGVRLSIPAPSIAGLLSDILRFFPLDEAVECPAVVMEAAQENGISQRYAQVMQGSGVSSEIDTLERFAFYERARGAAGIVVTADTAKASNIIIKKGVVRE